MSLHTTVLIESILRHWSDALAADHAALTVHWGAMDYHHHLYIGCMDEEC